MSDYTFSSISIVKINPHRLRNIFIAALSVILIVSVLSALSARKGYQVLTNSMSMEVYPFSANTVPPFSSVSFFSSDGKTLLKGWFFRAANSKKVVIFVHDFSQNRLIFDDQTDIAINECLIKGYNVLLFDQRNSGNVLVSKNTLGLNEAYDIEGAVSYAKALDMREIFMISFGAGANAVLNSSILADINGLVLDSPYYSYNNALKNILRENNVKTIFFTKTFTRLFLRILDSTRNPTYEKENLKTLPPLMITRSGYSYISVNEENKLHSMIESSSPNTSILAAISSSEDLRGYLEMIFKFFDEYISPKEE